MKLRMAKVVMKLYSELGNKPFTFSDVHRVLGYRITYMGRLRDRGIIRNITPIDRTITKKRRSRTLWKFTDRFIDYMNTPRGQEELAWAQRSESTR